MDKRVSLKIEFQVDPTISDEDVIQWVEFITGERGDVKLTNPLCDMDADELCDELKGQLRIEINGRPYK